LSAERIELERFLEERSGSRNLSKLLPGVLSLVALTILWWVLTATEAVSPLLLPPPGEAFGALVEYRGPIAAAALITLVEVLLGFALAVVGGVVLAIVLSYSRLANSLLYPPLLLLHSIPKVAVAPILLIWFGFGLQHKVVLSFLVAFFPIVIALNSGLRRVDPDLHDLSRSMHASWFKSFTKIDLPFALPSLFSGLRVAVHLAVVGAVIAEFVSGDRGLAHLLRSSGSQHNVPLSFACAAVLSGMSAALFGVVALLEKTIAPWSPQDHR
jgi:NitT/TauT family transport system permease protein